jgi:signal transduction histidine kinase
VSPPPAPWSLQRRVMALSLLICTFLAFLAAGATTTALANRGQLDTLLDSVGPMRAASLDLADALNAQAAAVGGFILTGSADERRAYQKAIERERDQVTAIETNQAVTVEVRQQLAKVTIMAEVWRTSVADAAIAAMATADRARATAIIDAGRPRFDAAITALAVVQQTIISIRDKSATNVKDTSSTLVFVLLVAVVLVIASGVTLVVALRRTVVAPLTHLAAQVRSVSRGNLDREITTDGPPELDDLAHDVDLMRRKIVADLTEVEHARSRIEEAHTELEQQAAELVRSNRDLEQFAYVASHDLQEPLRKVASFCQLLQRRYQGQLDQRADEYLAFAVNGAQRMQRLINDLLAFSRIGRNTSGFTDVDLNRVVTAAREQASHDDASVNVTWSDLPAVRGEETLLTTLFTNLIGNAVKFARPGVPPRVHVTAQRAGTEWEISCADNGIGIEPEYTEKVFVIFQRLHARDAYPGTGIGLAVAKKIVEYHGGRIWIDHQSTPGATIRFTLPNHARAELAA